MNLSAFSSVFLSHSGSPSLSLSLFHSLLSLLRQLFPKVAFYRNIEMYVKFKDGYSAEWHSSPLSGFRALLPRPLYGEGQDRGRHETSLTSWWVMVNWAVTKNPCYLQHLANYTTQLHREYFIGCCKDPYKPTSISWHVTRVLNAQLWLNCHDWINWKTWIAKLWYSIGAIQRPAGSFFRDKRHWRKEETLTMTF